jgi:hypothetical protein
VCVLSITAVQPLQVAAWSDHQTRAQAAPSVKELVAAIRHLFDRMMTRHVIAPELAASAHGGADQFP